MDKFYSDKSKARRALNIIGEFALKASEQLLKQGPDGRWGFDYESAEAVQDDNDNYHPIKNGITSMVQQLTNKHVEIKSSTSNSTIVKDGKKVSINGKKVTADKQEKKIEVTQKQVTPKFKAFNQGGEHICPTCSINFDQTWANEGVSLFCHHCTTTYSATTGKAIRAGYTRTNVSKGYKIDKDRMEQNGVKHPSGGTVCCNVWEQFDVLQKLNGVVKSSDLILLVETYNWNKNNVSCEFYQWRKFHGIKGRNVSVE